MDTEKFSKENPNPYDFPVDDLPGELEPDSDSRSWVSVIWEKLPTILLYAGMAAFIMVVVWGCHQHS